MSNINIEYEDDDYYEKFQKELSPRTNYGEGYYRTEKKLLNLTKTNIKIMSKYIIIDAEAIQKRIEELEKYFSNTDFEEERRLARIDELEEILSKSTPLIPEIEKAFDEGKVVGIISYQPRWHILDKELYNERKQDYISNLKLGI